MISKYAIAEKFKAIQSSICNQLELLDDKGVFSIETWERPGGGGGTTRVIGDGNIIEKGGVNFSAVEGELPLNIQEALKLDENEFYATGVSIVLHPHNPWHPIIHMNIRYFELKDGTFWFGGGIDLTPIYVDEAEAKMFHSTLKNVCDKFDTNYHTKFKKWADDYFYIKHRKETRGIGGIFFDKLNTKSESKSKEEILEFVCSVGNTFAPLYTSIINSKGKQKNYTANNKNWQYVRRGRYVEFNLVYDKGTKFGLDTDGRIESILMSLPPQANWVYNHQPVLGSQEEYTLQSLKKNIDWI